MASAKGLYDAVIRAAKVARRKFPVSERNFDRDLVFLKEALYALSKTGDRTEHIGRFDAEENDHLVGQLIIECDHDGYLYIGLDPALDGKRVVVTVEVLTEDDPR